MNKDLIFREPVYNSENQFMYFHYWGFNTTEGSNFTNPTTPTNNIKPKDSERYTGIKDCDGNPIYEGDIIEVNGKVHTRRVVFYCKEEAAFKAYYPQRMSKEDIEQYGFEKLRRYTSAGFEYTDMTRVKVIGNIHQNPEILITHIIVNTTADLTAEKLKKFQRGEILPLPSEEFVKEHSIGIKRISKMENK